MIGGNSKAKLNESLAHEWTGLDARWRTCRPTGSTESDDVKDIDDLLNTSKNPKLSNAEGWRNLNRAEQLVATYLTEAQLGIEFASLLDTAKSRNLSSLAMHQANLALFPASPVEQRRAAYVALLHDLQSGFVYSRFLRRLNSDAGTRLFAYGLSLVGASAFLLIWLGTDYVSLLKSTLFLLAMVASFGCTGAYFSRVMAFQADAKAHSISYDSYLATYVDRMLRLRILYGMIGAIIFYFILRSGIVSGSVFPSKDALSGYGAKPLSVDADLACLLVWSFIAGFSERLVPDTLTRIESKGSQGASTAAK
jgi:hypothetical protein